MIRQQHFVRFVSPGTLFNEESTRPIESWDVPTAVRMATEIVERHGARPFAFCFETYTVSDPIPDGSGGRLKVEPRREALSGLYHLGGQVLSLADVERMNGKESALAMNMRSMGLSHVIESTRSGYKTTQAFQADDAVVDDDGRVIYRIDPFPLE